MPRQIHFYCPKHLVVPHFPQLELRRFLRLVLLRTQMIHQGLMMLTALATAAATSPPRLLESEVNPVSIVTAQLSVHPAVIRKVERTQRKQGTFVLSSVHVEITILVYFASMFVSLYSTFFQLKYFEGKNTRSTPITMYLVTARRLALPRSINIFTSVIQMLGWPRATSWESTSWQKGPSKLYVNIGGVMGNLSHHLKTLRTFVSPLRRMHLLMCLLISLRLKIW